MIGFDTPFPDSSPWEIRDRQRAGSRVDNEIVDANGKLIATVYTTRADALLLRLARESFEALERIAFPAPGTPESLMPAEAARELARETIGRRQ